MPEPGFGGSVTDDPSTWRLRSNVGYPYRVLGISGRFGPEEAEMNWRALFRSTDLIGVMAELFPGPIQIGNVSIPQAGVMPGAPGLGATRASFKSHDTGKPIDPLGADPVAALGTYHGLIEVDVTFKPIQKIQSDPHDPTTFLEISGQESAEIIYSPPKKIADEDNSDGSEDEDPSDPTVDPVTGEVQGSITEQPSRTNQNPQTPTHVVVPTIDWSLTWRQIPYNFFRNVIVHRLRIMQGRVNSSAVPFLYGAGPETLLYAGHQHREVYSWRDGNINTAPIDVTLKIMEKRVIYRGIPCGWNHTFEPNVGWRRVYVGENGDERPYRLWDFNWLFS